MTTDPTKPWLNSYAPGVPHTLPDPTGSLFDLMAESVATYPDHVALEFFRRETTYAELGDQIARAAEGLRELGVKAGDPVAISLPSPRITRRWGAGRGSGDNPHLTGAD